MEPEFQGRSTAEVAADFNATITSYSDHAEGFRPIHASEVIATGQPNQAQQSENDRKLKNPDIISEQAEVLMLRLPIATNSEKTKPSVEEPSVLELKPLPEYLKYAFMGQNNTLPVIISAQLNPEQERKLIQVLVECK